MIGVLRTSDVMLLQAAADRDVVWVEGWFCWRGRDMDVVTGARVGSLVNDGYLRVVNRAATRSLLVPTDKGGEVLQ